VTERGGNPDHPRAAECDRCDADDEEPGNRRDGRPVGHERARCEEPDAALSERLRRRGERARGNDFEPAEHGHDRDHTGRREYEDCAASHPEAA